MSSSDNETTNPVTKSILRKSSDKLKIRTFQFDEKNLEETYHPIGKSYGHMKINEPDTPYERSDGTSHDNLTSVDPKDLFKRLQESDEPDELKEKKEFESHRKEHYDEFQRVQEYLRSHQDLDDDDDDDDDDVNSQINNNGFSNHADKIYDDEQIQNEHLRIAKHNAELNKHVTENI